MARGGKRYVTVPLKFGDVMDFKYYVKSSCTNTKRTTANEKVNWLKIKWIQVRRDSPKSLFLNYSFDPQDFMEVEVMTRTRRKTHASTNLQIIPAAYSTKIPISVAKKQDLVKLCQKDIIPEEFHSYYMALPTSACCSDRIPAPASDESDEDLNVSLS